MSAHERAALTAAVQEILDQTPGLLEDLRREVGLIAEVADTTAAVDLMAWRPAEKEASRQTDAEDLRTGRKTPADLAVENHLLAKAGRVARDSQGRPLIRAIGGRPLVRLER